MENIRYSSWMLERIAIGDRVRLRLGTSTIGRHSSSNIRVLDASYISRHHAIFEVADNDENVSIKDVSSNGIYVNDVKYDKETVQLKNNDLIGIGVSPASLSEDMDIIRLPIYQLKYLPMKKFHIPKVNIQSPPTAKPGFDINSNKTGESDISKKIEDNSNLEDLKPFSSKTPSAKTVINPDEIFEISDDDECDVVEKPERKQIDMMPEQKDKNSECDVVEKPERKQIDMMPEQKDKNSECDVVEKPERKQIDMMPKQKDKNSECDVVEKPERKQIDMMPEQKDKNSECDVVEKPERKQIDMMPKQKDKNSECDVVEKPERKQIDMMPEQKDKNSDLNSNENKQNILTALNDHINDIIKNEPYDDKDFINPSQKGQENKLDDAILNENNSNSKDADKENNENEKNLNKPTIPVIHTPIISSIKKERLRSVSADIQSIFGDIEDCVEIQKAIKEINPLIYNEMHVGPLDKQDKVLSNGAIINLTCDDDFGEIEVEDVGTIIPNAEIKENKSTIMKETNQEVKQKMLDSVLPDTNDVKKNVTDANEKPKSPNIFDSSLDNSKEEARLEEENLNNKAKKIMENVDDVDFSEYTKYVPNSDDEDIEDLMFSQVIINDMKDELQAELTSQESLPLPNTNIDNQLQSPVTKIGKPVIVKQEPGLELFSSVPKELENSCWIISDDEDYDQELETKVNDWSNKIFSQNLSFLTQNASQVYEMENLDKSDGIEEDDDCFEGDNLSILEDDIDGIAYIYNNIEELNEDRNNEIKSAAQQTIDELDNKSAEKKYESMKITEGKVTKDDKVGSLEVNKDKVEWQQSTTKETSPFNETNDCKNDTQSPLVRMRRSRKTNPVIESPSSSEDELDVKNNKPFSNVLIPGVDKVTSKLQPPVIEAPALPKHKGKLRGVSAASVKKTLSSIKEKISHERYTKDLKRKWLEKPSIAKKRDKEQKKLIKECRKDKLKELAERKKKPNESIKRKLSSEGHEHKAKIAKVKVTTHNRGAFLANNDQIPPLPAPSTASGQKTEQTNQFKIPKLTKKPDESKNVNEINMNKRDSLTRSLSVDCFETFSEQISKPDALLLKSQNNETKKCDRPSQINKTHNPAPLRRHSITDTFKQLPTSTAICKEAIAARAVRTTNKITFASMAKNIEQSEENKRKLSELNAKTSTPVPLIKSSDKKKKTVHFNDTPVIHYIERVTGACKKINYKDVMPLTSYKDRRHKIRSEYPILDHTETIISNILCWSNEWLIRRNAAADAAVDVIYPMPTHFTSFEHYKSIIFPLMKLEFISTLEREYNSTQNLKKFQVSLEYASYNNDRIMLVTKFSNNQNKELADSSLYDLVILQTDQRGPQIFAYVVANRKGAGTCGTIVYEIIAKNFTVGYFKAIEEFNVRPVMDKVRVHFGAFNSVYQLESTPLFHKIINPLELLKNRPPPKKIVIYRGFDKLNEKQKQVLLNTYVKIIDESTPNITLIQGPPGTGKSCVISNLVLQTLYGEEVRYLDKKILICAQSNAAVDVIASKLLDVSLRMRPEKRFRLIRYGVLNKISPNVLPIALQKVVEHDQLKKLQARNKNMHLENKENLRTQILQFEAQIAEMSSRNINGTVEEDVLIEKKRQLQLMRNILNESMRPEDERSLFSWYLSNANIVCATLSSCVNLSQYIDFFDICIIDEATQCTEPWTLLPLKFGINSLVLVGDTQQLPATVISKKASELGLGTSMFTRIQQCLDNIPCTSINGSKSLTTTPNSIINCLQTQYRMHPEICRWPNQYFYRNELINAKSTIDFNKSPLLPFSILSLTYTQNNTGINGKITNNLEAEFVAKLLKALDGFIPNRYNSYGVITPYAHHRVTLEASIRNLGLTNIMVNTIDSYQGLEKDVIVISNARTNGVGFLCNPQRLNVALTRSRKCLILCGNFKILETVPAWRCLLENARERNLYFEVSANCIEDIQANVIHKIKLKNQNP